MEVGSPAILVEELTTARQQEAHHAIRLLFNAIITTKRLHVEVIEWISGCNGHEDDIRHYFCCPVLHAELDRISDQALVNAPWSPKWIGLSYPPCLRRLVFFVELLQCWRALGVQGASLPRVADAVRVKFRPASTARAPAPQGRN